MGGGGGVARGGGGGRRGPGGRPAPGGPGGGGPGGRGGGLDGRLVSVLLAQLEQDAEILPVSVEHGVTVDESLVDTQMTEKLPRLLRLLPEAG